MAFSVFNKAIDLDVLYHPILNAIYYTVGCLPLNLVLNPSLHDLNPLEIFILLNVLCFSCVQLVEIIPSALVLYILRKLPPKRLSGQYHPIR